MTKGVILTFWILDKGTLMQWPSHGLQLACAGHREAESRSLEFLQCSREATVLWMPYHTRDLQGFGPGTRVGKPGPQAWHEAYSHSVHVSYLVTLQIPLLARMAFTPASLWKGARRASFLPMDIIRLFHCTAWR